MRTASVIVPTARGGRLLENLLASLSRQTIEHQVVVIDNGTHDGDAGRVARRFPAVKLVRNDSNLGYGRAVNLGVRSADGDSIVLVNDDCSCDPHFVERIVAPLGHRADVAMVAGVMRDARKPDLIETAGMELDHTLLVFDYLNGERIDRLATGNVPPPVGPCGAAAAFDREAFLAVGGFDERLFAYWEDVDLVLRLRREGAQCTLAEGARGTHQHSGTLGPGSVRKNYLAGFGRAYVLRKWRVLTPRRLPAVLGREVALCLGQAAMDRNLAGVRGRIRGYLAAEPSEPYPKLPINGSPTASSPIRRRIARRMRMRT